MIEEYLIPVEGYSQQESSTTNEEDNIFLAAAHNISLVYQDTLGELISAYLII